jgi:hypothetical protein
VTPKEIIAATYAQVLPGKFHSPQATVLLHAIGLQESRFVHRKQIGGPATGFWQFERGGGVRGVLTHPSSAKHAAAVCLLRDVPPFSPDVHARLVDDDILACAFARLLLYTDPRALPAIGDVEGAWDCYIRNWRPGKPHRHTWDALYTEASK